MAEFAFCFLMICCKNISIVELSISFKEKEIHSSKIVDDKNLNAHKSVKLCEFWTFYWYLCDLVFTCACFISNQNAHSVDTLTNFSNFAIYEMLPNDIMSK